MAKTWRVCVCADCRARVHQIPIRRRTAINRVPSWIAALRHYRKSQNKFFRFLLFSSGPYPVCRHLQEQIFFRFRFKSLRAGPIASFNIFYSKRHFRLSDAILLFSMLHNLSAIKDAFRLFRLVKWFNWYIRIQKDMETAKSPLECTDIYRDYSTMTWNSKQFQPAEVFITRDTY